MKFEFRNNIIKKYCKNKIVLDLGFLGEDKNKKFSDLHNVILNCAKEVWGVDVQKEKINKLRKEGHKVVFDDVQILENLKKLNKKFDVIVAGEIIEHLENPGLFLDNIKNFLNDDGILIITTPNIFSLRYILRHTIFGQENPFWKNRENEIKYGHVIGFSKMLLENLLLRKEYHILEFKFSIKNEYKGLKANIEKIISKVFPKLAPTLVFVCKVKK